MVFDDISGQFINLTTFRKDGTPVPTTVWYAHDDDGIVVPTGSSTGKVKRIRNNPRVTVAKSSMRGNPKGGPTVDGTARILEGAEAEAARDTLKNKYGIQWRMTGSNTDMFLGIAVA